MKQKIAKAILWFFGLLVVAFLTLLIIAWVMAIGGSVLTGLIVAAGFFVLWAVVDWAAMNV